MFSFADFAQGYVVGLVAYPALRGLSRLLTSAAARRRSAEWSA